jgi:hypothetical protein
MENQANLNNDQNGQNDQNDQNSQNGQNSQSGYQPSKWDNIRDWIFIILASAIIISAIVALAMKTYTSLMVFIGFVFALVAFFLASVVFACCFESFFKKTKTADTNANQV